VDPHLDLHDLPRQLPFQLPVKVRKPDGDELQAAAARIVGSPDPADHGRDEVPRPVASRVGHLDGAVVLEGFFDAVAEEGPADGDVDQVDRPGVDLDARRPLRAAASRGSCILRL